METVLVRPANACKFANLLVSNLNRAGMVHELLDSMEELKDLPRVEAVPASSEDLKIYHQAEYIDFLESSSKSTNEYCSNLDDISPSELSKMQEQYGLIFDCPVFAGLLEYVQEVAGGTITAVDQLARCHKNVALNWEGGRHHAQKSRASGYCYVNDIVLGIIHAQKRGYKKILYIDLDLHHGDGVQNAFYHNNDIVTLSFHHYDKNTKFFPGTGGELLTGDGKNKRSCLNVPLKQGLNDENLLKLFDEILVNSILSEFDPDLIILQAGCDGLAGDPLNIWNLTSLSFLTIVKKLLDHINNASTSRLDVKTTHQSVEPSKYLQGEKRKLLILGGGGYNSANTARCWASISCLVYQYFNDTLISLESIIETLVPDHEYSMSYGPHFDLEVSLNPVKQNLNTSEYIGSVISSVLKAWNK